MASGGKRGLAQSLFQVGGNAGSSLGPLLAVLIILPRGQGHVAWFSVVACLGIVVLWRVGAWQWQNLSRIERLLAGTGQGHAPALPRRTVIVSLLVLIAAAHFPSTSIS